MHPCQFADAGCELPRHNRLMPNFKSTDSLTFVFSHTSARAITTSEVSICWLALLDVFEEDEATNEARTSHSGNEETNHFRTRILSNPLGFSVGNNKHHSTAYRLYYKTAFCIEGSRGIAWSSFGGIR